MGAMDGGTHQGNGHTQLVRVEQQLDALTGEVHGLTTRLAERLAALEAAVNARGERYRAEIDVLFEKQREHKREHEELGRRISALEFGAVKLGAVIGFVVLILQLGGQWVLKKLWP